MATLIKNYNFDKTNRTIVFNDYSQIKKGNIVSVKNVTKNIIMYDPEVVSKDCSTLGNVLTLVYDTSAMSNSDILEIIYESQIQGATEEKQDEMIEVIYLLKRIAKLLQPSASSDIMGRQRVAVDNIVSVLPATYAISTYPNRPDQAAPGHGGNSTIYYQPTWAGPVDPRWTNLQNARLAYNTGIRSKLLNT